MTNLLVCNSLFPYKCSIAIQECLVCKNRRMCPLIQFSTKCDIVSVQRLLEESHSVNRNDYHGITPLIMACIRKEDTMAELLLQQEGVGVNMKTMEGETALHRAAANGMTKIVEKLLICGAEVDAQTFYCKHSPLHFAAREGHTSVCERLLSAGANSSLQDYKNNTALHYACAHNKNKKVISILVHKSPEDLCSSNLFGHTPFFSIFTYDLENKETYLKYILSMAITALSMKSYSMMLNHQDVHSRTLLHYAIDDESICCTQVLLAFGAETDFMDENCFTPLAESALFDNNKDLVALLLSAGASTKTLCTEDGIDSIFINPDIVQMILTSRKRPSKLSALCRNVVNRQYGLAASMASEIPAVLNKFLSFDRLYL